MEWVNDWARYRAQDLDGFWFEYEDLPELYLSGGMWDSDGRRCVYHAQNPANPDWENTLETRCVDSQEREINKDTGAHYRYSFKGVKLDPYRIFSVYGVTDAPIQHAIKKLLRAGRGDKSLDTDVQESIDSLLRWQEMREEEAE